MNPRRPKRTNDLLAAPASIIVSPEPNPVETATAKRIPAEFPVGTVISAGKGVATRSLVTHRKL